MIKFQATIQAIEPGVSGSGVPYFRLRLSTGHVLAISKITPQRWKCYQKWCDLLKLSAERKSISSLLHTFVNTKVPLTWKFALEEREGMNFSVIELCDP